MQVVAKDNNDVFTCNTKAESFDPAFCVRNDLLIKRQPAGNTHILKLGRVCAFQYLAQTYNIFVIKL